MDSGHQGLDELAVGHEQLFGFTGPRFKNFSTDSLPHCLARPLVYAPFSVQTPGLCERVVVDSRTQHHNIYNRPFQKGDLVILVELLEKRNVLGHFDHLADKHFRHVYELFWVGRYHFQRAGGHNEKGASLHGCHNLLN